MQPDESQLEQLWELVYGLLSDDEAAALCEQVRSDPELARAYATVKLQSELLAEAARADEEGPRLVPPQSVQTRAVGEAQSANWRPLLRAVTGIAAILLLGFGLFNQLHKPAMVLAPAARPPAVASLIMPQQLHREVENPVMGTVSDSAAPAEVELRVYDQNNELRLQQRAATDMDGLSRAFLPGAELPDKGRLEVVPVRGIDRGISAELNVQAADPLTYLALDKLNYQPGETVNFRSVTMNRFASASPAAGDVQVQLQDSVGNTLPGAEQTIRLRNGVASGNFAIPSDATAGNYQLLATGVARDARQSLDVGAAADSLAEMAPATVPQVDIFPEGGQLVAGLQNRVYFQTYQELGTPAEMNAVVVDSNQAVVASVATTYRGRGRFEFAPQSGATYALVSNGNSYSLPATVDEGVTLRVERGVFSGDEAIAVVVRAAQPRELLLTASSQDVVVGLERISQRDFAAGFEGGVEARRSVSVVPQTSGVVRLRVFQDNQASLEQLATRLVFVRSQRTIDVQLEGLLANYQPGQQITLAVRTTDEDGTPQSAILHTSMGPGTQPGTEGRSLPTYHYLTKELGAQSPPLVEADCDWLSSSDPQQAVDLVLGTANATPLVSAELDSEFMLGERRDASGLKREAESAALTVSTWTARRFETRGSQEPPRIGLVALAGGAFLAALLILQRLLPVIERRAVVAIGGAALAGSLVLVIGWGIAGLSVRGLTGFPGAASSQVAELSDSEGIILDERLFETQRQLGESAELSDSEGIILDERLFETRRQPEESVARENEAMGQQVEMMGVDARPEAAQQPPLASKAAPATGRQSQQGLRISPLAPAQPAAVAELPAQVGGGADANRSRQLLRAEEDATLPPATTTPTWITDEDGRSLLTIQLPQEPGVLRLRVDAQAAGLLGSTEVDIVIGDR